jgi:hypothetical protein
MDYTITSTPLGVTTPSFLSHSGTNIPYDTAISCVYVYENTFEDVIKTQDMIQIASYNI